MEVERIGAAAVDSHVFGGVWSKALKLGGKVEGDFGLVGPAEDLDFERRASKLGQVFGLNVLEVDEDDIRFHVSVSF